MWDFLPFCLLHITSIIIFYSTYSSIYMACAHVLCEGWKSWSALKSMNQLLGSSSGLCMMGAFCVTKMKHGQTVWFCRDKLAFALLFWKDMIALLVRSKYYHFYVNMNFCLESFESEYSCHIKKITFMNMLESIPHQKFCFYHLPTRGRAGIKLGDAWDISNVSIIFYCSMLLYFLLWMFNGL